MLSKETCSLQRQVDAQRAVPFPRTRVSTRDPSLIWLTVGGSHVPRSHYRCNIAQLCKAGANAFGDRKIVWRTRCSVLRGRQQDFRLDLHPPPSSGRVTQRELELFADWPAGCPWPLRRGSSDHGAAGEQGQGAATGTTISVTLHELRANAVRPSSGVFSWKKVNEPAYCMSAGA